ncbi:hypothetical protein Goarm_005121 [Gossypium armourianum]|uniref:Gnk2-homologous domain-containing protein n=1 Tax=Gossypium armourianum TaxID=34283 RepID=A0A7J9JYV7_9ROSI|nr:hypothetical protein [Gossypium armourianum]
MTLVISLQIAHMEKNRDLILASLLSTVSAKCGFLTASIGQNSDKVYTIAMCRGDFTPDDCYKCVNSTIHNLIANVPTRRKPFHGKGNHVMYTM